MKLRRYYKVSRPNGPVVHIFEGKKFLEGERTRCGIAMQKGWVFWPSGSQRMGDVIGRQCKRCYR